jgi:hypothetical protein
MLLSLLALSCYFDPKYKSLCVKQINVMPDAVIKNVKLVDILPKVSDVLVLHDKSSVFVIN